jgi:protoporphyrinogen oxidase
MPLHISSMREQPVNAIIVGAGPAGLTAAYELSKRGRTVVVLECDPEYVGGLARTIRYRGFRFDIGGHRFFSKSQEIEDLWKEILGPDLLERPRSSKIYYRGRFYSYPLRPLEALTQLGFVESVLCVVSFLRARAAPTANPKSYEDWVVNQFGRRLYNIFFKTYTEKIWGMSCREISADWAAQRIQGLSLGTAIKDALWPKARRRQRSLTIKSLIDRFHYPRLGPGMMWEACAEKVRQMGSQVLLGRTVERCRFHGLDGSWTIWARTLDGAFEKYTGDHLLSSMPIRELVRMIEPELPEAVRRSAGALRYRDFITVGLILRETNRLKDNWIYIHDPGVKVGRVQNYKAWSPEMVADPKYCCYGLEYFCFKGDGLWNRPDQELIALAKQELQTLQLAESADVLDGCVMRQLKAYPVYDEMHKQHVRVVREALEEKVRNIHLVGRNGMHKYNNQDHAMMTGLLAARNILAAEKKYDVWAVNDDASYHEGDIPR